MEHPILELKCHTQVDGVSKLISTTTTVKCHIHSTNVFFEFPHGDGFSVRKDELLAILSAMGGGDVITNEAQIKSIVYDAVSSLFNQSNNGDE